MLNMKLWIIITIIGLVLTLIAERKNMQPYRTIFKMVSSTAFIMTAVSGGALSSRYGMFILAGLVLSWWGDLFLVWQHPLVFQAGLVSFLLAHVTYVAAFISTGPDYAASGVTLAAIMVIAVLVLRWLNPHLTADMRYPVYAYIAVISTMVVMAAGAARSTGALAILVGAVLFYLSDISVARDRFVAPGFTNALWGLPLYYAGQLVLAYSVTLA